MRIGRRAQVALAAVLAATLINGGVHAVAPLISNQATVTQQASHREEFWRVVDGSSQAKAGSPDQALASDLSSLLGPQSPAATTLPEAVITFRSPGNAVYGGVTELIGIDPFTNDGCLECGPLTSEFKAELLQVKQGHVDALIRQAQVAAVPTPVQFTPFGLSVWQTILLLAVICAVILATEPVLARIRRRKEQARLTKLFPRQIEQIEKADQLLAIEPPSGSHVNALRDQLITVRDKLATEIARQADPHVEDDGAKVDRYEASLRAGLQDLLEVIAIDEAVRRELGLSHEDDTR